MLFFNRWTVQSALMVACLTTSLVWGQKTPEPADEGAKAPSPSISARGQVVDQQGQPIEGASVFLRRWPSIPTSPVQPGSNVPPARRETTSDILAQARTNSRGEFQIQNVPAPEVPGLHDEDENRFQGDLVIIAPGHGTAWGPIETESPIRLILGPERTILGRIQGSGGEPIEGAKVRVSGIVAPGPDGYHSSVEKR